MNQKNKIKLLPIVAMLVLTTFGTMNNIAEETSSVFPVGTIFFKEPDGDRIEDFAKSEEIDCYILLFNTYTVSVSVHFIFENDFNSAYNF